MTKNAKVIAQSNKLGIDFSNKRLQNFLTTLTQQKEGDKVFTLNGESFIFTYKALENSDWLFVSVFDESEIYKNLKNQLYTNIFASIILFSLGLGTIFFISSTHKELHEKHLLLSHFAKSPTWGILLTDKNGKIIFINKVFESIFNILSKSLYGKSLDLVAPMLKCEQPNFSCFADLKRNLLKLKSYTIKKDGKVYRIQITPLLNKYQKELEGAIITINDVTHEKELEIKEVAHEQILIQNSKMAALGEMISAISHQWRQPLSTLLMLISSTEEIVEKEKLPKANNYLNRARSNIELMNETINAFRNFYKEDYGKVNFDLVKLIDEIILISSPQMVMNGIELEFIYDKENNYTCENYPSYLKQVLINLIGNAKDELAYILKENPIYEASIKIFLTKKNDKFYIIVEDNGRGILHENKDKIFEPFFTTKAEQGTGTGLYLCKLLVESKMNGKFILDHKSKPTIFVIEIGALNV